MERFLIGGIWPRSGFASPQRRRRLFSPALRAFLAQQNSRLWPPSALLRPLGCGSIAPGLFDPIKAAMGAAEMNLKERPAWRSLAPSPRTATASQGTVKTLTLNAKVRFVPVEKDNDKSPDFWVIAGTTQRRARCRLEEDLEGGPALHLGQARRSELPGPDLRLPDRGRGRRPQPDLVPLNPDGGPKPPSPSSEPRGVPAVLSADNTAATPAAPYGHRPRPDVKKSLILNCLPKNTESWPSPRRRFGV